jgi:soluble lytic murein transglycosylase-like protein
MPKLPSHIGVPAYRRRVLVTLATIALSLVVTGFNVPKFKSAPPQVAQKKSVVLSGIPTVLSETDATLYYQAFVLQGAGHLEEADMVAAKTDDPLLRGVLLGERYIGEGHEPSFSELALWLSRYGDHAQAPALYTLARERAPEDADFLTEPPVAPHAKAITSQYGSELAEEKQWVSGLAAFRRRDMTTAAAHFKLLLSANGEDLSPDDRAAVAFWSYRSLTAASDRNGAKEYLKMAAVERPGFYSLLARHILDEHVGKSGKAVKADADTFMNKGAVRRAIALKQIGKDALAEKELRTLFPGSSSEDRNRLVQLAKTLHLPAEQMRMAVAAAYDASASEAFYPLPRWTPTLGYHLEPALLFAIIRQESGFNPNAKSASGAMGVMQLMPATAHAMAVDARLKFSPEPAVNMTLGQHYIEHLMDTSSINDNLILIIAAYNAGPGSVANWQKNVHTGDDPLLFIESIPNEQTREYVEHVMGNYWVYSDMLGGRENLSIAALSHNRWPHYERTASQTILMVSRLSLDGTE